MEMEKNKITTVENKLGYTFNQPNLLVKALTHSSYANEVNQNVEHNERLEFLGDAVLELSVSEELFRRYPQAREGGLTNLRAKLVSEPSLAKLAKKLELQDYIFLGKGEENQGGRERSAILCDCLESILGAVFLDGGYDQAKDLIINLLKDLFPKRIKNTKRKDYKSWLQEITQKRFKDRPIYKLEDSFGPEHSKIYLVQLSLPDGSTYQAQATSVKKAEQLAAKEAIQEIEFLKEEEI